MVINVELNQNSIGDAINELKRYKDSLRDKCVEFVEKLAEYGIAAASYSVDGEYRNSIEFTKESAITSNGAVGSMVGRNTQTIIRMWMRYDQVVSAEISPILMAEFGSGIKASDATGAPNAKYAKKAGAGRGTFPGQTHADDDNGWSWMDLAGEWHHSTGEEPSMPMFNAYLEMKDQILNVARQVFST